MFSLVLHLQYIPEVYSIHCRECRHSGDVCWKHFFFPPRPPSFPSAFALTSLPPSYSLFYMRGTVRKQEPFSLEWRALYLWHSLGPIYGLFFIDPIPLWGRLPYGVHRGFLCNPHCLSGAAWSWWLREWPSRPWLLLGNHSSPVEPRTTLASCPW